MSKLNERLTLIANLSVVVGIVFLAVEMRQNTEMMQAQIRDSLTDKQMEFNGWVATTPELAAVQATVIGPGLDSLSLVGRRMWSHYSEAVFREWENSHYQFRRGLFTAPEFEARVSRWRMGLNGLAFRQRWSEVREGYSPSFRAEIDRIVAEVEQAQ